MLSPRSAVSEAETAVALGIFDGVHRGHREVIGRAAAIAREKGLSPAVCTFNTGTICTKGECYRPIYSDDTKRMLLENEGIECMYSPDFSEIRNMSPEEFVKSILRGVLNAREVICGADFRFGRNASCSAEGLMRICSHMDMGLTVVDDVTENGIRICSADIRRFISEGDVHSAGLLLGQSYAVSGEVIHGNRIGHKMNFPTANQKMNSAFVMPKFGVYISYADIDGRLYRGITNIGVKPTVVSDGEPLAETHFPDFSGDLYGRELTVRLEGFIRPERRFESTDELSAQIKKDLQTAMAMPLPIK